MQTTGIVEALRMVVQQELRKLHFMEIGIVTSVFPHSSESDKDNYECNVNLRETQVELRKVPVLTQHIGLSNIVHVNDLVLVSFINGDFNSPVIVGRLYNDEDRPPLSKMEEIVYKPPYTKNDDLRRINIVLPQEIVTLNFHDDKVGLVAGKSSMNANSKGEITVMSSSNGGGTTISITNSKMDLSSNGKGSSVIAIDSEGNIHIKASKQESEMHLTDEGISLKSKGNIKISTPKTLSLGAANIRLESNQEGEPSEQIVLSSKEAAMIAPGGGWIKIDSSSLIVNALTQLTLNSGAKVDLTSTAMTSIKGGVVNIN